MRYEEEQDILDRFREMGIDKISYGSNKREMEIILKVPTETDITANQIMYVLNTIIEDFNIKDYELESQQEENETEINILLYYHNPTPKNVADLYKMLDYETEHNSYFNPKEIPLQMNPQGLDSVSIANGIYNPHSFENGNVGRLNSNDYTYETTKYNNMRDINHIIIEPTKNNNFNIKWVRNITSSTTTKKGKDGSKKEYTSFFTFFPKEILDYLDCIDHVYFYEHFEKICVTGVEPPSNVSYKKIKTNINVSKKSEKYELVKKHGGRNVALPKKYWGLDLSTNNKVEIILHHKPDYIKPEQSLVTMDVVEPEEKNDDDDE